VLDGAERSGGASAVAAGGGTATVQAVARKRGSSGAAAAGGSVAALPSSRVLGSEGRKRDEREVRKLTLSFLKIFNGSSKSFEYESCSKFKILQLSF